MDETFLLMLSNLLHLHNSLDPTTSLLSPSSSSSPPASSPSPSSPSSLLSSSSPAPLIFFTLASILSFLATSSSKKSSKKKEPNSSPSPPPSASSHFSVAAFRALSTDHIWSMDAPTRDAEWRSLYGLSYPVFTTVVEKLKPFIAASNLSLPSDYAVAMVLSRLCHGYSAKTIASRSSLDPYIVSKITNMVTRLLATKLYPEFIKIPGSRRRLIETTQGFEELTSLPNICGAIDGSPIKVRGLKLDQNSTSSYKCKYGYDSVLLQVVADHRKIFWDICVKAPGGADDATHFRDSLLYNRLTSGDIVWDKVINVRGHHVRPYIVGDWCYPLLSFLMTPFSPDGAGTPAQNLFDGMLMKGRSVVVEAIGLLKMRWKILRDLNIAREPEPEIQKDPDETGAPARVLESEKQFYYFGESLRQALADDLHQRLSSR
ncbi:putative nucleic acid binding protein [Hibiscus syriacus]|uniref:Nucleic acid binding protein n=1 Tax=Hibiscus syriacus TaxID=106335 RepID=A0A6A2XBA2_HIBSY|nr:putative nucleic acid binding protein [Hibiscus syriacus]